MPTGQGRGDKAFSDAQNQFIENIKGLGVNKGLQNRLIKSAKSKPKTPLQQARVDAMNATGQLEGRANQPISKREEVIAGRGTLMDALRDMQRRQSARLAASGLRGSEAEVAYAGQRGQLLAGGIRDLVGQGAAGQRADTALMLQAQGQDNALAMTELQLAEARKTRKNQNITNLVGGLTTLFGA